LEGLDPKDVEEVGHCGVMLLLLLLLLLGGGSEASEFMNERVGCHAIE